MRRSLAATCAALAAMAALGCQPLADLANGHGEGDDSASTTTDGAPPLLRPAPHPTHPGITEEDAISLQRPPVRTAPAALCSPTVGSTLWVEEGDPIEVYVRCGTGVAGAGRTFAIDGLPEGADFDPQTGRLSWTPGLDQAAVYLLTLRDLSSGEQSTWKLGVADRFDDSDNEPIADPSTYTEEFGLPVFHLTHPNLSNTSYSPATLVYRGRSFAIDAKYRGSSSLDFPKKSYTLKFPDTDEFRDPLVGFGNRDRLVLVTSFNDNSYLRARLAFEVWSLMDPSHLKVKTFSAVVYANGEYLGVYTACDRVDKDLIGRHGLSKAGNLFKAVSGDANFSEYDSDGHRKSTLHDGYEKKEGLPPEGEPGAFDDLDDLTRFVIDASEAEFHAGLGLRVNQREYEDWWIFVTLLLATDSPGKNAFHYRDPLGGPFRYIPWDLDASLGQDWATERLSASTITTFSGRNELFRRMLEEPAIAAPLRERYSNLLSNELSVEVVLATLERLHEETHAAAVRDERRWKHEHRDFFRWDHRSDFNDHEGEIAYLRSWITKRWATLQQQVP